MDKLISEAGTSYFWLVQVVLALLVGLAATYLKGPIDSFLGKFSERRRARNRADRLQLEAAAQALAESPSEVQFVVAAEMRHYMVGLSLMVMSVCVTALPFGMLVGPVTRLASAVVSLIALVFGLALVWKGLDHAATLRSARVIIRRMQADRIVKAAALQE